MYLAIFVKMYEPLVRSLEVRNISFRRDVTVITKFRKLFLKMCRWGFANAVNGLENIEKRRLKLRQTNTWGFPPRKKMI